jgi:hypothetical protein
MDAQHRRSLGERCQGVVAKESGPPFTLWALEQHVMPAVGDRQITVTIGSVNRVGARRHAVVGGGLPCFVEVGTDEVIPAMDLCQEGAFEPDVSGIRGFQEAGLLRQPRQVVLEAGNPAVLPDKID